MNLLYLRRFYLISIVIIVNFIMLPDSQALFEKHFSLTTYCIGGENACDNPENPFDKPPYIYEIQVDFNCDIRTLCMSGNFYTEGGYGGGHWMAIPPFFRAFFNGKLGSLDLVGIWLPGIMTGFGNSADYFNEHSYDFFFVGKRTFDFDY